jgi:4-diphosphocytidyl-2-C-methyl-D-erythritol kinase
VSGAAPAKINVCLFLGPVREQDGRHELVTVMQPVALADTVRVVEHEGRQDACVCDGVEGPNLALQAVAAFREATGWDGPPVRVEIDKVIPVAGGMAGGSADAAAVLRLLRDHAAPGTDDDELRRIGSTLGADVPSQVVPVRSLATGAGEHVEALPPVASYGVLVVRSEEGLSTADVFREADRLGLPRTGLADVLARVRAAIEEGTHLPDELVVNELQPAALSLRPDLEATLEAVRAQGADVALVSGSGPTVLGLFADRAACAAAADALGPAALATETAP